MVDRSLAALLLIPGIPIMLVLWVVVRLTSRGPALFQQVRVGRGGSHFMMYKIRTMVDKAESNTGPIWASPNDPRLTTVGYILRKIHLDELPQLWNVVRGDMSLVGPRPERPEFTKVLAQQLPGYLDRLLVLPGVTGLAQANLPPDTDLDSVRRKLVLDREYVERGNLSMDLRLLAYTIMRLVFAPRHLTLLLLGLVRNPDHASPASLVPAADTATDMATDATLDAAVDESGDEWRCDLAQAASGPSMSAFPIQPR